MQSCSDDSTNQSSIKTYPQTESNSFRISSYEEFSNQKSAWKEPENYTFKYEYGYGDSERGAEFVTIVTDGKGVCSPNSFAYRGSMSDDDEPEIPLAFTSISKLYEHFDGLWKNKPEEVTDTSYTAYSAYFTKKDGITYPSGLYQTIGPRGKDVCGYGGETFDLKDYFSLENHKTFSTKKSAWKEPEGAYSFTYTIFYDYGRIGRYSLSMEVSVDKNGNSTVTPQRSFDSFKKYYGDLEIFGTGDDFGKFKTISEIYELIEKIWTQEEEKAAADKTYGLAPFFTAQDSYDNYKIPYNFEYENFAGLGANDEDFGYTRIDVWVRNWNKDWPG